MSIYLNNNPTPYPTSTGVPTPTSPNVTNNPTSTANTVTGTNNVTRSNDVTGSNDVKGVVEITDEQIDARAQLLAKKAIDADAATGKAGLGKIYDAFIKQYEDAFKAESRSQGEKDFWHCKPNTDGKFSQTYSHSAKDVGCKYNNFTVTVTSTTQNVNYSIEAKPIIEASVLADSFQIQALRELEAESKA